MQTRVGFGSVLRQVATAAQRAMAMSNPSLRLGMCHGIHGEILMGLCWHPNGPHEY